MNNLIDDEKIILNGDDESQFW